MIEILQDFGYAGMFVASFLAGSVFPFSSEAVMTALSLAGLNIWALLAYSTVGNTLGGMFNYGIGRLGNEDWMYRLFRFEEERVTKAKKWVRSYGAWMGLLSWIRMCRNGQEGSQFHQKCAGSTSGIVPSLNHLFVIPSLSSSPK